MTDPVADDVRFLQALADPVRLSIVRQLIACADAVCACDFVECCTVSQPTISHHLKKLEEADLVQVRQEGRFRYYTLNQERMTVCCGALVRQFAPDYSQQVIRIESIEVKGSVAQ